MDKSRGFTACFGKIMQEKMKECIDQWLEHQKKPEVKLAIFGYTEEDIKSNVSVNFPALYDSAKSLASMLYGRIARNSSLFCAL